MTATGWELVGGDPSPGEPGTIDRLAARIGATADRAAESHRELTSISAHTGTIAFEGDAASAFAASFDGLVPDLSAMAASYERAGQSLRRYATDLARLQREAAQALERARLADERRRHREREIEVASSRIRQLEGTVSSAQSTERALYRQYQAEAGAQLPSAPTTHGRYLTEQSRRRQFERDLGSARHELAGHEHERRLAEDDLGAARSSVRRIRDEHDACARRAASEIRAALDDALHNKSTFEKGVAAAGKTLAAVGSAAVNAVEFLSSPDFSRLVYKIRKVLDVLDMVVSVILLGLAVVAFVTGVGAPLALLLAAAAISTLKLATTVLLVGLNEGEYVADDGDRVGFREVVWDTIGAGAALAAARPAMRVLQGSGSMATKSRALVHFQQQPSLLGYVKRQLFPDARTATGLWREVPVVPRGTTIRQLLGIPEIHRGTTIRQLLTDPAERAPWQEFAFERAADAHTTVDDIPRTWRMVEQQVRRLAEAVPSNITVGGCYAH